MLQWMYGIKVNNINANRIYDKKDRARLDFIHLWVTFGLYMTGK